MAKKKSETEKHGEVKKPKRKAAGEKSAKETKDKRKAAPDGAKRPGSAAGPGKHGSALLRGPGKAAGAVKGIDEEEPEELEAAAPSEPSDFVVCCQAKSLVEAESIRALFEENKIPAMIEGGGAGPAKAGAGPRRINVLVADNKLEDALDLLAERDQTSLQEKKEHADEFGEASSEIEEEEEDEEEDEAEGTEAEGEEDSGSQTFVDEDEGHFGDDDEDDDLFIENDEE